MKTILLLVFLFRTRVFKKLKWRSYVASRYLCMILAAPACRLVCVRPMILASLNLPISRGSSGSLMLGTARRPPVKGQMTAPDINNNYCGSTYLLQVQESIKINGIVFMNNINDMQMPNFNMMLNKMEEHFKDWNKCSRQNTNN